MECGYKCEIMIVMFLEVRRTKGLKQSRSAGSAGHYRAVCLLKKRDGVSRGAPDRLVPQKIDRLFRKVRVKRWGKSPPRRG